MTTLELLVKNFQGEKLTEKEIQQVNKALEEVGDYSYNSIAIEQLEDEGYALGNNLWHINDISEEGDFMSEEQKLRFLNNILSDDYIKQEINEAIQMSL